MVKNLLHTNEDGAKLPWTEESQFFGSKRRTRLSLKKVITKSDNVMMKFPDPLFSTTLNLTQTILKVD